MAFDGDVIAVRPDINAKGPMGEYMNDMGERIAEANGARDALKTMLVVVTFIKNNSVDPEMQTLAQAVLHLMKCFGVS